jgi:hypothetical protein
MSTIPKTNYFTQNKVDKLNAIASFGSRQEFTK